MRVAVIGYNIFAIGGTTRSNLNLLASLAPHAESLTYFNYLPFDNQDVHQLCVQNVYLAHTKFKEIKEFFNPKSSDFTKLDVIFITREDLLPISKILRVNNPNALIIGEIHTPLALLDHLSGLDDLSCVRVATDSIKEKFSKKFKFDRIYVQNVALSHLKWGQPDLKISSNYVIKSRFFEKQKDIMASLRMINGLKKRGLIGSRLYIQGAGPDEFVYRDFIKNHQLEKMVLINQPLPEHYTYLSTSRFETLGYSIAESVAAGHHVLAYPGDDDVIYENFHAVPMINWLEKNKLDDDVDQMIAASHEPVSFPDFEESRRVLEKMAADYYQKFEYKTKPFCNLSFNVGNLTLGDYQEIRIQIESQLGPLEPGLLRRTYYRMIKNPVMKKVIDSQAIQRLKNQIK